MPVLIAGLILSFLIMLLFGGTELDRTLLILAGSTEAPRLDRIAGGIDWLASDLPLLAATAAGVAYAAVRRRWREAILLAIVVLLGRLSVEAAQLLTSDLVLNGRKKNSSQDAHLIEKGMRSWSEPATILQQYLFIVLERVLQENSFA